LKNIKNILIEVNSPEAIIDPLVLYYITLLNIGKVYFYHLSSENDRENDDVLTSEIHLNPEDDLGNCKNIVQWNFPEGNTILCERVFLEGDLIKSILKVSVKNDIDLILFKYGNSVSKEEIIKIAKNSYCSILTLPEGPSIKRISNILLPLDFSQYSRQALELALKIAETGKIMIILNHVYFVPSGYHATGKSYEESALLVKQAAKKECQMFLKDYDLYNTEISYSFILDDDKDPTDKIYNEVLESRADLLIIGAKGTTNSPNLLTGSTAFSLLINNQVVPMIIIKNKRENYDLAENVIINS